MPCSLSVSSWGQRKGFNLLDLSAVAMPSELQTFFEEYCRLQSHFMCEILQDACIIIKQTLVLCCRKLAVANLIILMIGPSTRCSAPTALITSVTALNMHPVKITPLAQPALRAG